MNNVLLGKTIKAMYKLSGKTLTQLSDETDLTVDTINNLFYARIQKPGLSGVNALVKAMGFSLQQLTDFLEANPDFPENKDITETFVSFVTPAEGTNVPVSPAKPNVKPAKSSQDTEIEMLNAAHEKEMERLQSDHQRHLNQLQEQHSREINETHEYFRQIESHFEEHISNMREAHEREMTRLSEENANIKKTNRTMSVAIGIETLLVLLFLILDVLNRSIGWLR